MKIKFFFVFLIALLVRLYGIYWDQGLHLHPDERMIIMVADKINFFNQLNPGFFNYGTLPIYILKGSSQILGLFYNFFPTYDGMLIVGRVLSIVFDMVTLFLLYKIAKLLFKDIQISILTIFFYSLSFFPIQNSHFFTVDILLTTLTTLFLWLLLNLKNHHSNMRIIITMAITFSAMLATKFTAIVFFPLIPLTFFLINWSKNKKIINALLFSISYTLLSLLISLIFFFIFMPFAFIDFQIFFKDIGLQLKMNNNPYIFPYTLQYADSIVYWYYLKNIFLWGIGPFISFFFIFGLFNFVLKIFRSKTITDYRYILIICFYLFYFLIIGRSAVKFMRYMLPLYPFFTLMAGYGFYRLQTGNYIKKLFSKTVLIFSIVWSIMFINIYTLPHTRIDATKWILKNIPYNSNIAVEHWDDRLPLYNSESYNIKELTLYDQPDDNEKWEKISKILNQCQYLIIASNRLYVPLLQLSNCSNHNVCYKKTAQYYQDLFSGKLGFYKVAEFSSFPQIQFLNFKFQIDDSSADESFTVYDHPKIMIFKKR